MSDTFLEKLEQAIEEQRARQQAKRDFEQRVQQRWDKRNRMEAALHVIQSHIKKNLGEEARIPICDPEWHASSWYGYRR